MNKSLANETSQAVAAVVAHEAQHVINAPLFGGSRGLTCYADEVSAFTTEATVWASFYGPFGVPSPRTKLELQENHTLQLLVRNSNTLIVEIIVLYQDECS